MRPHELPRFLAPAGGQAVPAVETLHLVALHERPQRPSAEQVDFFRRAPFTGEDIMVELREIFVTHYHADHYLGLPGMLKTFALRGVTVSYATASFVRGTAASLAASTAPRVEVKGTLSTDRTRLEATTVKFED